MKYILLTLLFSVLSFAQVRAETVYACDSLCQDIEAKAVIISMGLNQDDVFSVVDFSGQFARTYRTDKYTDPRTRELIDRTIRLNTSSTALSAASHYRNVIASSVPTVTVPKDLPNTPQNDRISSSALLIQQPQLRDHIANWLKVNASLNQQLENIASQIAEKITGATNFKIVVELTFDDSSTADFTSEFYSTNAQLETRYAFVTDSARFADGSSVPTLRNQFLGDWIFSDQADAASFERLGGLWRVVFINSDACKPQTTFECRENSDGEVECTTTLKCQ